MTPTSSLHGKVVLITGASSGIGEATARYLAACGASVSLAARRQEKLTQLVADITQAGGKASAFTTDVRQQAQVEALVQGTIATFGRLDVVFNNAGVFLLSKLESRHYAEWEQMIDVNLKGMLYAIGAALPHFAAQQSGHFINVSSIAGHFVYPASAVYSATKFAVRAVSEGLRQEVKPYNIRTTILSPGLIRSEINAHMSDNDARTHMEELARIAIAPEAVARAVAYAIEQPAEVDINEIILRPTAQLA